MRKGITIYEDNDTNDRGWYCKKTVYTSHSFISKIRDNGQIYTWCEPQQIFKHIMIET